MEDDTKALIRRLFAEATALVEDAHELAVRGQSSKLSMKATIGAATALRIMADDAALLAQAALVLARRAQQKGH